MNAEVAIKEQFRNTGKNVILMRKTIFGALLFPIVTGNTVPCKK